MYSFSRTCPPVPCSWVQCTTAVVAVLGFRAASSSPVLSTRTLLCLFHTPSTPRHTPAPRSSDYLVQDHPPPTLLSFLQLLPPPPVPSRGTSTHSLVSPLTMSAYKKDEESGVGQFFQDKTVRAPSLPLPFTSPPPQTPSSARCVSHPPRRRVAQARVSTTAS